MSRPRISWTIRLTRHLRANVSKSGVSLSPHAGPVTWNTRTKRTTVRLPGGFTWRSRGRSR